MRLCGRRGESGPFKLPTEDTWRDDNTCSYCGGLNPEVALKYIEAGARIVPTDKSYKIYIDRVPADSGLPPMRSTRGKSYFQDWQPEHQKKLIELLNDKKITFAEPGHFYVLPFFMRRESKAEG